MNGSRRSSQVFLLMLAAASWDRALAAEAVRTEQTPTTYVVPGPQYRTIQEAIDAVPDGTVLDIAPGVYRENLRIAGKRLRVAGARGRSPRTEIVARDETEPVITYGGGGGGSLADLALRGGTAGVLGEDSEGGRGADLTIRGLTIRQTGRGIYGSFSRLELLQSRILATRKHAVSLLFVKDYFLVRDSLLSNAAGAGLFVLNEGASGVACDPETGASICIHDSSFVANDGGGIMILGGAQPVSIRGSWALANRLGGIVLFEGGAVTIRNTETSGNLPLEDGRFGTGILAVLSQNVIVTDSIMDTNAHAGVAAFGCTVSLGGNWNVCNAMDMNDETIDGTPGGFIDLGGNLCGCVGDPQCVSLSSQLGPPPPLDP